MRPAQGRRSAAGLENAPEHHVQDSFVLSPLFISHLSLDDVEEEIRVAAAAQEVSQTEGLVQGLHLILDLGWRSARWTPDHEQKQSCDEGKYIFSRNNVDKRGTPGVLLRVQAGELGQQQAVALSDGLLGGGRSQVALEGQDFLFLPLGDLKLPVDHLRLCVLVGNGARRVGVVTAERE